MFNAGNRRQIREREKTARQIARDSEEIFTAIMGEYSGRRWFHDRFLRNHIFSSPFNVDPIQMAFNCGMQNDALQEFLTVVQLCPNEYLQMMKEAHERDLAADTKRNSSVDDEREAGNLAEAERLGILAKRDGRDEVGDEDRG
jgi:hypothetical protein